MKKSKAYLTMMLKFFLFFPMTIVLGAGVGVRARRRRHVSKPQRVGYPSPGGSRGHGHQADRNGHGRALFGQRAGRSGHPAA